MKVNIPNLKALGDNISTTDALTMLICILEFKVHKLSIGKTDNAVDDIDIIAMQMTGKILKSMRTLILVCSIGRDYASACALLRIVVDNISVYNLIYANEDPIEKEYRHYLYVLDGICVRESQMKKDIEDRGNITKDDLEKLQNQYKDTRDADSSIKQFCIDKLNNHTYAKVYPDFHEQCISNNNWKFKDTNFKKDVRQNQYSWKDLYSNLNLEDDVVSFISLYLSQFVHGLILSNINLTGVEENFEPILSITTALLSTIQKDLEVRCPNNDALFSDFMCSPWGSELLQYVDIEHITQYSEGKYPNDKTI
ncbi:MAG: hypothetical protein IJZ70_08505 [Bacteroidales bacterium]|nr:hypothetical protein [Bacteroidales bacterium]